MSDDPRLEQLEQLLRDAGPRPTLPEEDLAAIRETARAEWQRRYGSRPSRTRARWWIPLVAAAAIAAAVGIVWRARIRQQATVTGPIIASVERVGEGAPWNVGSALSASSEIETDGTQRLALRMAGGASARLDAGTRIRLASATLIELRRGAAYVDTRGGDAVAVRAPAGLFQPAGTQFEVRVDDGTTRLNVREGSVRLERGAQSVRAAAGEGLVVSEHGGLVRRPIPPFGPEWEWVLATAPMPEIEGMKVRPFLDWISRETGWRVGFADHETARLADSIDLHGSISHLTPVEATGVVLSSAGLEYRVSDGTLVVAARGVSAKKK
jgi:ferric-dicitrate binding protein FerR (iron transport regulator)